MTVGELISRLAECQAEMPVLLEGGITDDLFQIHGLEAVRVTGTWIKQRSTDDTGVMSVVLK